MSPLELRIPTADDRSLGALCHEPVGPAIAQVVIHGATATPLHYYGSFARHLAWRGLRVLTYDYRGIGRSRVEPLAADPVRMQDWIDDAAAAQRWLVHRDPSLPLLAIGHSFGGQIAPTLDAGRRPRAIVLVGAGSGYWRGYPSPLRHRLWLTWSVAVPLLARSLGRVPGWTGIGEDLPGGVARQWARWCRSPEYFLSEHPSLREQLAGYTGRVRALSFEDDELVPEANARWLLRTLEGATVEHLRLSPSEVSLPRIGHFGFFRATAADRLWPLAVEHLVAAAHGREAPPRRSHRPGLQEEIMLDLEFGRA
ncbi:MAG: alpha/beta fold hydrolase [Myxococcales bacterium]|nr:alpha/beta fold hydrolase [Myxococcales bacterium]